MARNAADYLKLLRSLFPSGKAWSKDENSVLSEFLYGEAEEFARVDQRSDDLLVEKDTRKTFELLTDHEIDLGLPDECTSTDKTIEERRNAVHSRYIALGKQNPAYFIEVAAAHGWDIAITEYSPAICGVHVAGDPCGDASTFFYWRITVTISGGDLLYFSCGSSVSGDYLTYLSDIDDIACLLEKHKPGHTFILWSYDGPEFYYSFDSSFDALPADTVTLLYGAFNQSFGLGFDVRFGGGFEFTGFAVDFEKPAYGTAGNNPGAFGYGFVRDSFDWYRVWT